MRGEEEIKVLEILKYKNDNPVGKNGLPLKLIFFSVMSHALLGLAGVILLSVPLFVFFKFYYGLGVLVIIFFMVRYLYRKEQKVLLTRRIELKYLSYKDEIKLFKSKDLTYKIVHKIVFIKTNKHACVIHRKVDYLLKTRKPILRNISLNV